MTTDLGENGGGGVATTVGDAAAVAPAALVLVARVERLTLPKRKAPTRLPRRTPYASASPISKIFEIFSTAL